MGSRKDILKNLGIPEYPWSSDDEEQAADPRQVTARTSGQQPTGGSTSAGSQQNPTSNLLFLSRLWPQSRTDPSPAGSTSSQYVQNQRVNPHFMSSRHVSINTPPPEILGRSTGPGNEGRSSERPCDDIRRALAFRRLTRNMNLMPSTLPRYRNNAYSSIPQRLIPRRYSRPGTVVPSEANSTSTSRWTQPRTNNRITTTSYLHMPMEDSPGAARPRRRRTQSMEVHNSEDDEPEEVPAPHATMYPLSLLSGNPGEDHPAPVPQIELETEVETQGRTSNDTSGSGVADEDPIIVEAIVDISDEPSDAVDLIAVSDHHMACTSQADEVDAPESEPLQGALPGIKRKRRSSSDDRTGEPPLTVKEFNHKLLRLLECPVCLECMEPPMSQCRRGHLVCSRCRSRLACCPVCRTTFSSVRNRAMEGMAEMLRYPCRHGCGREVRLRRRAPHEASCAARKYACPVPLCQDKLHLARDALHSHIHTKHQYLVKNGPCHRFGIKVNSEAHDNWLIIALDEVFHVKVDVDIRTWGVIVYVAYIGPKCNAMDYAYEVSIEGQHNGRKMNYRRATHSDLESSSHNVSRQDCFHLSLDQALNFIRYKNRQCDAERILEFEVQVSKIDPPPSLNDSDS